MNSPKSASFNLLAKGLFLLLALMATSAAQTYVFNTAQYATGHNPQSIANADLNSDGIPDLVVANYNDNTVSVFLGTTIGVYASPVTYETGTGPIAIAIADFNADTKLDLAVVNNNCPTQPCTANGSVSVLLGNGDGTFQPEVSVTVGKGPSAITSSAIISGNSAIDLLVANNTDNKVTVLLNNGAGVFSARSVLGTGNGPISIASADFNQDGFQDVVIANFTDSDLTYYIGNGKGSFTIVSGNPNWSTGPNPVGMCIYYDGTTNSRTGALVPSLMLADTGSSTVSFLKNRSPNVKGWNPAETFNVAAPVTQLACTDVNNDGVMDVVATSPTTNQFSALLAQISNGVFNFLPHVDYATGTSPSAITTTQAPLLGSTGLLNLPGFPSFTGSLSPGLAIVNSTDNTLQLFPGSLSGAFQMPQSAPASYFLTTGNQPAALASADFNGDGMADIAVVDRADNQVLIFLNNGNGTFTQYSGSPVTTGMSPVWVATGDFNGDGIQDMVTANASANTLSVFYGNGDGSFTTGPTVLTGKKPVSIVVTDLNSDGRPDLGVVNTNDPSVETFLGNSNGTFTKVQSYTTGAGSTPNQIVAGDFNADGSMDLAVAGGGNNSAQLFLGQGTGKLRIATNFAAGTNPTGIAAADFNGDGFLDLAVANNGSSTVSILLGTDTGSFATHVDYPTATTPFLAFAQDVNGDAKQDLLVSAASSTADRVSVLVGNGDGSFQTHVDHTSIFKGVANTQALVVADFNGDGSPDFATADQLAKSITVYLNNGVPTFTPGSPLDFGGVDLGLNDSMTITVNNEGSAPLDSAAFSTSGGGYSQVTTCGTSILIGANCEATATFTPTQPGTASGSLNLNDDGLAGEQSLSLTGAGNGATAVLSVTSLTFPLQVINTQSSSQLVTLTNTGNENLSITVPFTISRNFADSTSCSSTLAPNKTCNINVVFFPTQTGPVSGTLSITDNALNSPQTVSLSGTGTAVSLSTISLNFSTQQVGTTSAPQSVTITNKSKLTLTFTGDPAITITGTDLQDFAISSNTCGTTLSAGANCTVSITFTPLMTGSRTAQLSISDNGGGSPQIVTLSGTGD